MCGQGKVVKSNKSYAVRDLFLDKETRGRLISGCCLRHVGGRLRSDRTRHTFFFPSSRYSASVSCAFFPALLGRRERASPSSRERGAEKMRFSRHEENKGSRPRTFAVGQRRYLPSSVLLVSCRPRDVSPPAGPPRRVGGSLTLDVGPAHSPLPLAVGNGGDRLR